MAEGGIWRTERRSQVFSDALKDAQGCDREPADCRVLEILGAYATHVLAYCW